MARNPRTPARTPARTPTTVDRITGAGAAIPLHDGQHVLRFDLAALAALEDAYGSISAANAELSAVYQASMTSDAPWAGRLERLLTAIGVDTGHIACRPLELVALLGYAWLEAFPAPEPAGKAPGQ